MKRLFIVLLGIMILAGCGAAARESGFYEHKTMYENGHHAIFSIYGYKHVDEKEAQMSNDQDWWGIPVEESK